MLVGEVEGFLFAAGAGLSLPLFAQMTTMMMTAMIAIVPAIDEISVTRRRRASRSSRRCNWRSR